MAMVNVVTIAAYRWICWLRLIGLVQRSAATWRCVLHSSDEPGELSQWQCTAEQCRGYYCYCYFWPFSQNFSWPVSSSSL